MNSIRYSIPVPTDTTSSSKDKKRCVRCGRCLAVCPYYRIMRREEFSPRGRVVLSEAHGTADTIRCFACLKCVKSCPYELSPLNRPGQVLDTDATSTARAFFDYLYYDTPVPPEAAADPQLRAWLAARGAVNDDAALNCASRFVNGELYHPFLQIELPRI